MRDPVVAAWAKPGAPDAEMAYRQAAAMPAMAAVDGRPRPCAALEATVIDSEPGRLPGELAGTYLQAPGRL